MKNEAPRKKIPNIQPEKIEPPYSGSKQIKGRYGTYFDDGISIRSQAAIERDNQKEVLYMGNCLTEGRLLSGENLDWMSGETKESVFKHYLRDHIDKFDKREISPEEYIQIPFCSYAEADTMEMVSYVHRDDWVGERHVDASYKTDPVTVRSLFWDPNAKSFKFVAVTDPDKKTDYLWADDEVIERIKKAGFLHKSTKTSTVD